MRWMLYTDQYWAWGNNSQGVKFPNAHTCPIPYVTNRRWTGIRILHCHFEWQGRPQSTECMVKHFASLLRQQSLQVSLFALVSIRFCRDLVHSGCNVKSLPALVRKELANCSTVLKLYRPRSFLPLKMAA